MAEHRLFVYGTLRDPEFARCLWGRAIEGWPAILPGHVLRQADGYAFVRPDSRVHVGVRGTVLGLDARELALADLWEDLPAYQRVRVRVHPTGSQSGINEWCRVWSYLRFGVPGRPLEDPRRIAASRSTIVRELRACVASARRTSV